MDAASFTLDSGARQNIWRAPLFPVALAGTTGIVLDRYFNFTLGFGLLAVVCSLAAWAITRKESGLALVYLTAALIALGAAYHRWYIADVAPDDIGLFVTNEPRVARIRGKLVEEPISTPAPRYDPLRTFTPDQHSSAVLGVLAIHGLDDWQPSSGRVRLRVPGTLEGIHCGDELEVVGRIEAPDGPANPGELDYAAFLHDHRIRALFTVQKSSDAIVVRNVGWIWSPTGWLAVLRGAGQRTLGRVLPADTAPVATALLLGDGAPMTQDDWDRYIRTGVVHVLAISGQHLVVLAGFFWWTLRLFGARRRPGASIVALTLLAYALMAGGRAPALRAAIMVCIGCGGILLRRPVLRANAFALAWIIVAALNPTDVFNTGCQLSFLCVALLYWGVGRWHDPHSDPLQRLIDESRPWWERLLRWIGRVILGSYLIGAIIWLSIMPLVAARYHLIAPAALVIGPPVVLLTSIALLSGFLLLVTSAIGPLGQACAWLTQQSLAACEWLVSSADRWQAIRFIGDIPFWWLWGFYAALLTFLLCETGRRSSRRWLLAGVGWLCFGLAAAEFRNTPSGMRCTFLAVGHGGCTVIETPEGRTLVYDAGSLAGPEVTRRHIAPFLWNRGVRRIDEVFLSHADLDHFNGMVELLQRFTVGQITCTPSFADRRIGGVSVTLKAIEQHGVPTRRVRAGDRLTSGSVVLDVLHPPDEGPAGPENVRSLVLRVEHAGHVILLTGDLEKAGLDRVLRLPPPKVDVLMAPHHGSRLANTPSLATWAKPKVVVACQARPRGASAFVDPYSSQGSLYLATWPDGAVTIRSSELRFSVETFRSGLHQDIRELTSTKNAQFRQPFPQILDARVGYFRREERQRFEIGQSRQLH